MTGSHNFSPSASHDNDENFVVVHGDRALAEAYAVNIQSAWRHYASRAGNPLHALTGIDYLRALQHDQAREHAFWGLASVMRDAFVLGSGRLDLANDVS